MDFSTLVAETRTIDINHPVTLEPIGLKIDLLPTTSKQVRDVQRKHANENIKNRFKTTTAEKLEANALDILVAATAGWTWGEGADWKGGKPELTPENVREVYKKAPWIRKQVDEALGDDAEFFRDANASAD